MTDPDREKKLARFRRAVEGLENVTGTGYDPKTGTFVALVTRKVDEDDLPDDPLVANNSSLSKEEHGVEEVDHISPMTLRATPSC